MKKIKNIIDNKICKISLDIHSKIRDIESTEKRRNYNTSILQINHAGEISAQYLYYGQSFLIKENFTKYFLLKSGKEEKRHLFWCIKFLDNNKSKRSSLYYIWKYGSFSIGILPSFFNYKYNLGFLIETEIQVLQHLNDQIQVLSKSEYGLFFY